MHILFEFLPLVLFLAAYLYKDIFFAMIVLMIAMPVGLGIKYYLTRRLDKMFFWSTVLLLIFGAVSLYFRNAALIYWKPTVFYWTVAAAFLLSQFLTQKTLAQRFFEVAGELPTEQLAGSQWRLLNLVWVAFLTAMGGLNLYVAYNFSEDFWVKFKVFGLMGISFVFLIAQIAWLVSKLDFEEEDQNVDGGQP